MYTVIESYSHANDFTIERIVIPRGVKIVDDFAFFMCGNAKTIEIPDTVEIIGDNAFSK